MTVEGFLSGLFSGTPSPGPLPVLAGLQAGIAAAAPRADAAAWSAALTPPMRSSGITTPRRMACFLGQVATESAGMTTLAENLNYTAERLCQVWPSRFPTLDAAAPYAGNPQALANHVYADRMGNGDEASGDGWLFRGQGLIQLTGRANYAAFATAMKLDSAEAAVAYVATQEGAAAAACWFWSVHTLNTLADTWSVTAITQKVNGGTAALDQRIALSNAALTAVNGAAVS